MRTNHVGWNPACSLLTSAEGDTFFPECSNTVEVHKRMRTNHVGWNSRLFVAVAAAVERGPISKWKTDRLGMGQSYRD